MVISTGPSNTQIEEVLWKEVRQAHGRSVLRNHGRLTANPQKLDFGGGVHALGYSTNKAERLQGHHSKGPLLAVVDEASGVEDPEVWATIASLKPRKRLLISNPIRPSGPFHDTCQRAERDAAVRLIRIPSLDSPDIEQEHSERGLADAFWLREMRGDYGEGSLVWRVRVLALFPDDASDAVFLRDWLNLAFQTIHVAKGPRWLSIDLGLGNGGDLTVLMVRDDNGVLHCECSNTMPFEVTATRAALLCQKYGIPPNQVSFDVEGIGADFDNRLRTAGINGAIPYRGGGGGSAKFGNLRSAAAWRARQRLDPNFRRHLDSGVLVPQAPFSLNRLSEKSRQLLHQELRELRYVLGPAGDIRLELAEDYALRLKRSPDHQACFCQSFAFAA